MEKVLLLWKGDDSFEPYDTQPCHELSPKELMLYSMGLCVGKTIVSLFQKMRLNVTRLLIEADGKVSDDPPKANSLFIEFTQVFHIEAPDPDDHPRIAHAIALAHGKYCGVTLMFGKIAPVKAVLMINGGKVPEIK